MIRGEFGVVNSRMNMIYERRFNIPTCHGTVQLSLFRKESAPFVGIDVEQFVCIKRSEIG